VAAAVDGGIDAGGDVAQLEGVGLRAQAQRKKARFSAIHSKKARLRWPLPQLSTTFGHFRNLARPKAKVPGHRCPGTVAALARRPP
jgi:hypothetical protein